MSGLLSGQVGGGGGGGSLLGFVTAASYGVVADGVTDDRANMQAAMNAAASLGAVLVLPDSTIIVGRDPAGFHSLLVPSGLTMIGVKGKTWIKHPNNAASGTVVCSMLKITACTNVVIRDVGFDGNWGNAVTYVSPLSDLKDLAALPGNVLNVESTAGFPASGSFKVTIPTSATPVSITYTGKTATSFTGCSAGVGKLQQGCAVGHIDKAQKSTTIDALSNGATLPTGTINVASTTGFPASAASGLVQIATSAGWQSIAYTSKNSTQLLGVTGGTGTMSTGGAVQYVDGAINQATPFQIDPKNHLIFIYGSDGTNRTPNTNITIDNCLFRDSYGDFIWVGAWSSGVKITNCTGDISARNAVTLSSFAENVHMERCTWSNVYTTCVDSEPVDGPTRNITIDDCELGNWFTNPASSLAMSIQGGTVGRPAMWNYASGWRVTKCRIRGPILISDAYNVQVTDSHLECDYLGGSISPLCLTMSCDDVWIERNHVRSRTGATNPDNQGVINLVRYQMGVHTAAVPGNIYVRHNVVHARNGQDGIYVEACGGYQGATGTATAMTAPTTPNVTGTLTDAGASWPVDYFAGHRVLMGGALASIVGNSGNQLQIAPLFENYNTAVWPGYATAWSDANGNPVSAPALGPYTIIPTGGRIQIEHNKVDCANTDGSGAGRHGVNITTSTTWDVGFNDMRVAVKFNDIHAPTGYGVELYSPGAPAWKDLAVVGNHVWDDQPAPTTTAAIHFTNPDLITNKIIYGNTCDSSITLVSGLTSGTWRTGDGYPASWAGYDDPNGLVYAPASSIYHRLNANAIYVKESDVSSNAQWVALKTTTHIGLRGVGTPAAGTAAITPGLPPSVDGDIELLIINTNHVTTDAGAATLSTPARFVKKIDTVSLGAGIYNRGAIWWRRKRAGDVAPVIAASSGSFNECQIIAIKDCVASGDPFNAAQAGVNNATTMAVTSPAVTTTVDGAFVLDVVTWFNGGPTGTLDSEANASLSEFAELLDQKFDVGGERISTAVTAGRMVTAGLVPATTATINAPSYAIWSAFKLALTPAVAAPAATSIVVTEFGAVGDGVTDDTAAVAAALAAAGALGSVLHFPPGTYKLTSQGGSPARCLTVPASASGIRFSGNNATLLFDSSVAHAIYLSTGCGRVTFSGLKFQGFTGTGADDFNVNAFAAVFTQSNAIDVTIDGCKFDHVMPAFFTSDDVSARLQFTRNLSTDQPNALSPPGYSIITDNFFHDTSVVGTRSHAIYIFGRAEHAIISRNSFKNQGDSCVQIRANDAKYLQKRCWHITDNYFEKCNFYGLFLSTLTSQINIGTCVITGNIFKNVVSPMQLIGMRDAIVANNVLEWDYQYAGLAGNGIILGSATSVEASIASGVHISNNRLVNRHPFYGAVTFTAPPAAGDTITVGSVTYTWRAAPTLSGEVAIGGTVDVCAANLAAEIQGASRTARNQVIRDSSDVWYSQNSTEGKLWIASNATFALTKTGTATTVTAVFNNSVAMAPAIDVSNAILPVIEGNTVEGVSISSAQMTIQGCVDPIIRNNTMTMQGGSGIVGKGNSRPIYQGNRATWSRAIASVGAVPNAVVTSYDAFAVMRDNGLVQDQDGTLPWLMGASGVVAAGDGRARTYLYYGNEVAPGNPAMATFHWEDGDMVQLWDGAGAPINFRFKRSGPNGTTEFNSYASLMTLINTQTGGVYTASNPALAYFGSDPLAYGYIEIKKAAVGTAGNTHTLDTSTNLTTGLVPKHRTCGVTLEKWYANATNSVFRGGAAAPTKTVVFTPLASLNTPLLVQGVDEASEALVPRCYAADTVPGVCYVITHNAATGTEKFFWKVA